MFTYEINTIRGVAGNVPENQYPYDFSYNFINSGSGNNGGFPDQGFRIAMYMGIPTVKVYGGFGLAKYNQWVSGYDKYFNGMANRADSQFTITVNTPDGITKAKQWLFDHGNGSAQGGCAAFCYDASGSKIVSLPSGTPQAGKKMMIKNGTGGGHAVTIAGYDDSVRYDFNGDGKYTNNIDINGDGRVDVRDWEIGAFVMVNSWGTSFANSGRVYIAYKFAAEGIWKSVINCVRIKQPSRKPLMTYKVTMSHSQRKNIRIRVGYATSASATAPTTSRTITNITSSNYPITYCGGDYSMQGTNSNPIELGFDISDFVSKLTTSEASLFLLIDSRAGTGTVQKFSLLDYTGGTTPLEVVCPQQNVNLPVGTTILKITKTLSKLQVLTPNGGEKWERDRTYPISWFDVLNENVKIELLKSGMVVSTISASAPSNGTFQWQIPANQDIGTDYKIRISSLNDAMVNDISNNTFSIGEKSTLALTSPVGGEYLEKGKDATITWTGNVPSNFKIDLYKNKIFDNTIAASVPGTGSYSWNVPASIPSGFNYTIRITSTDNQWLYEESKDYFAIGYPVVTVPYTQTFDAFPDTTVIAPWEQAKDDDIDWMIWKGPTPSKSNPNAGGTGPNGDHTSGSGKYAYLEASTPNHPGKTGEILSPIFNIADLATVQVGFWCHMFSKEGNMGQFWVDVNTDGIWKDSVMYLTGDHGDKWFDTSFTPGQMVPRPKLMQVRFRVETGADYDGDVCIDDFRVSGDAVPVSSSISAIFARPKIVRIGEALVVHDLAGSINIYSLSGAKVLNSTIKGSGFVDISKLPKGAYLAKLGGEMLKFVRY